MFKYIHSTSLIVDDIDAAITFYVDAVCDMLKAKNVEIIHGPIDEEWGGRGAFFKDPFGNDLYVTTA